MLEEVDGEEMTFLMHTVAGCCEGMADEAESKMKKQKEREKKREEEEKKQKERKKQQNQSNVVGAKLTSTSIGLIAGAPESKGEKMIEVASSRKVNP